MSGWIDYAEYAAGREHTVVGSVRVLREFESPQLGNRRDLFVCLPPTYGSGDRTYPVICMHDGQNLFDARLAPYGEWEVDETMVRLAAEGLEALVVGVPNAGERRSYEYLPLHDPAVPAGGGGGADLYLRFLSDTVIPRIEADFRVRRDRDGRVLIGSSLGGYISLYAFLRRPDLFAAIGVLSPAFFPSDLAIMQMAERELPVAAGRIYMDIGSFEYGNILADQDSARARSAVAVEQARMMRRILNARGYRDGERLLYVEEAEAVHNESAWARRLPGALRFLLPGSGQK